MIPVDSSPAATIELPEAASARGSEAKPTKQTLLHAVAWTGASRWAVQLLTWTSTIATARILAPSDYGLIGMATVYLGFVALLNELGLGQAAITLRELSSKQIAQLNSLCIMTGVLLFVLSCSASVALGKFFHSPKLPAVVAVMSVTFLVSGAQVIPDALLQGDLRFKLLAWFDTTRALIQACTTVGLAVLGFGYWSLAFGPLAAALAGATMAVIARPHALSRPKWREIKHAVRFGRDVLGSRVAWYTYSNSDFLVAGRVLGQIPLGAYTIAWTIASTPVEKITNMMTRVTPAFFAAAQNHKVRLREYLLGITQALSLLTFPACIGLALVADEFVLLVLGPKWIPAIVPLQILSICAALRSVTTVLPNMLFAIRDSRFVMWNTVLAAVVFPPAFYLGSHWGTSGIAWAWIVTYPIITAPYIWRTLSAVDLRTRTYLGALVPALRISAIMIFAVLAARLATPQTFPVALRFTIAVAAGIAAYAGVLFFKERDRLREVLTLMRGEAV